MLSNAPDILLQIFEQQQDISRGFMNILPYILRQLQHPNIWEKEIQTFVLFIMQNEKRH